MAIRNYYLETTDAAPPEGWARGYVTLRLIFPDERVAVEAWQRGAFAVHPTIRNGEAVITHAPTGTSIWTARSMEEGAKIVERIEPLADWSSVAVGPKPDLRQKVRDIINEVEHAAA